MSGIIITMLMHKHFFIRKSKLFNKKIKLFFLSLSLISLISCSTNNKPFQYTDRGRYIVDNSFPSQSQNERIRFLIMHYTALDDDTSLKVLTQGHVSAHYLVNSLPKTRDLKPVILQLVPEEKRAWHAGISSWNGRGNINDTSIGIEIVNLGFTQDMLNEKNWFPFNDKQIDALAMLTKDIIERNKIEPDNILGHSDIAPLRKQDPGRLFPWKKLALMGIGAWPDESSVNRYLAGRDKYSPGDVLEIQKSLKKYGYDKIPQSGVLDEETRATISAFQMHFRQDDIAGNADAETEAIAKAMVEKYRKF